MRIYLTTHTNERMALRGINLAMIKKAISEPDEMGYGYFERLVVFKKFSKGVVKVVYAKEKEKIIIISVIWHKINKP